MVIFAASRRAVAWCLVLFLAFAAGLRVAAQIPDSVLVLKLGESIQTTATQLTGHGVDFAAYVSFPVVPAPTTTVEMRTPRATIVTLVRQTDGTYEFDEHFASETDLGAAYSDGTYVVLVNGASAATVNVSTGAPVSPVLITDFDLLQASDSHTPWISWQSIPAATRDDLISINISHPDGTDVWSSQAIPGTGTFAPTGYLPAGIRLTADLTYVKFSTLTTVNGGATQFACGRGFNVEFTVICSAPGPVIIKQPASKEYPAGANANLEVEVSAAGATYQWYRNGVPIAGATSNPYIVGAIQASLVDGSYTVQVANTTGAVMSDPATVVVGPGLQITTLAGSRTAGSADGLGRAAQFRGPKAVAVDTSGNVYVADGNQTIRKITPAGAVTTLAGQPGEPGSADGQGSVAQFHNPGGVAVDQNGYVYVADTLSGTVRKITPDGTVSTLAGQAGSFGFVDGAGAAARFFNPTGIWVNAVGEIFVADAAHYTNGTGAIRKISPTGVVSTLAGKGSDFYARAEADGLGASAVFRQPGPLVVDRDGNIVVADTQTGSIRKVTPAGVVTTLLRTHPENGRYYAAHALALDATGTIFVIDSNHVKRLLPDGTVNVLAGSGFGGDVSDGLGVAAGLSLADGLAIDSAGVFYIADTHNNAIRRGTFVLGSASSGMAVLTQPRSLTVAPGDSIVFSPAIAGPVGAFEWRKDGVIVSTPYIPYLQVAVAKASDAGTYVLTAMNAVGVVTTTEAKVTVASTPNPGRIINLSIRSTAGTGARTLIAGFVIGSSGPGAGNKSVLLRGVGPGLTGLGVGDALSDSQLTLFQGSNAIASNDDWPSSLSSVFAPVGAFPLAPGSLDAATSVALAPGAYSVHVTGKGAVGTAMVELYDRAPSGPSAIRLINVSARTQVGTADNILIAGFVIGGDTAKTVLIRGVGPSLKQFGISASDCLADPKIDLYAGGTLVATDDEWDGYPYLTQVANVVGAFQLQSSNSKDAALQITLNPGLYTVHVSGTKNTTGVALVEVYEVP